MQAAFLPRLIAPFLFMIAGLIGSTASGAATVEGTATYRERMLLPPNAVFEAIVVDLSRADAAAEVLGRAVREPAGNPPFRFSITVDPARVKPGGRYAVRATVRVGEQLLFTTDRVEPVLDGRNAPVELLRVRPGALALDLLPPRAGCCPDMTTTGSPGPNTFDDNGRWTIDRERDTFAALGRAARYVIEGSHLDLYDEGGVLVARFEAVALRR